MKQWIKALIQRSHRKKITPNRITYEKRKMIYHFNDDVTVKNGDIISFDWTITEEDNHDLDPQ